MVATATKNRVKKSDRVTAGVKTITISPPNFLIGVFEIEGTAPYVQHRFSSRPITQIEVAATAGSTGKKGKKKEPKDFEQQYQAGRHISDAGWDGIPASAFRSAMIAACRLVGFMMTFAKLSVFIEADGLGAADGVPLIRIHGKRECCKAAVRNPNTGGSTICWRPMYKKWTATVRVRFDADQFTTQDITNLLMRAGMQVGVGEGRPGSKSSNGCGWGTFDIKSEASFQGA